MQVIAFGAASRSGPELVAAALAALAIGLLPYGMLHLFARACYALGDSRTPAVVALASSLVGVATMVALVPMTDGAARVAALGIGHTVAYSVGALVLGAILVRRIERRFVPTLTLIAAACAVMIAGAAWLAVRAIDPEGRITTLVVLSVLGVVGAAGYGIAIRRWWPATPEFSTR